MKTAKGIVEMLGDCLGLAEKLRQAHEEAIKFLNRALFPKDQLMLQSSPEEPFALMKIEFPFLMFYEIWF